MTGINKTKKIAKSFLSKNPKGEEWYEKRMKECNSCEYNSDNIEKEKLSTATKLKLNVPTCNSVCTACGCCINQKASTKTETCGLVEIGKEPKWDAVSVEGGEDKSLSLSNLSDNIDKISISEGKFFVFLTCKREEKVLDFKLQLHRTKGLDYKSNSTSCGCTAAEAYKEDNKTQNFNIRITTNTFKKGWNQKTMTINHLPNKKVKKIHLVFKVNVV